MSLIMASIFGSKSKSFMTISIPPQDEPSINRPVDVLSTSDCHLIELKNQVQRLMEAHLAPKQHVQVNKISSSCEICSGPHDTQYCMKNPEQAFVEYASSRTDEAGGPQDFPSDNATDADITKCNYRGARVDVRTYLLGGAIDSSEANGIICDPKLELENSRFTFDLVPLSYESVDVVVGENWLLRHKAEMVCHEKVVKMPWQEVWNDCRSCKVRVGSNGNLLWEASVLLGRKKGGVRVAREDDRGVTEGREDVREVFQQRGSGAKRKLSRCGRNQMGNEPILALPEGADDFVVYYDARSKDLEACLEKG
ncbi:hypothetical protein Tco_1143671 [Tanacetum coccineum]